MLKIGSVEVGTVPRIAVPLSDVQVRNDAAAARRCADIFELRIDTFENQSPEYAAQVCRDARAHGVPLIATVRTVGEGGKSKIADADRLAIFKAVAEHVDAMDIEFRAPVRHDIKILGRQHHKPVIFSYHNFERMPTDKDMLAVILTAKREGAEIVKMAAFAHNSADMDHMLGMLREHRAKNLVMIALGEHGKISRVVFPLCGSLLTFGFLHAPNAPGQVSIEELNAELCRYSPEFARMRNSGAAH